MKRSNVDSMLIDQGREMATNLIESIVKNSKSNGAMNDKLFTLKVAALHILGSMIYNDVEQLNVDPNICHTEIVEAVWGEYELFVQSDDIYKVEVGGQEPPKDDSGLH